MSVAEIITLLIFAITIMGNIAAIARMWGSFTTRLTQLEIQLAALTAQLKLVSDLVIKTVQRYDNHLPPETKK